MSATKLCVSTVPLPGDLNLSRHVVGRRPLAWIGNDFGLLGVGGTVRIDPGRGPGRWERAQDAFDGLCAGTRTTNPLGRPGTGLVAFGSFSFDPDDSAGSALIVPALVLGRDPDGAWLTTIKTIGNEPRTRLDRTCQPPARRPGGVPPGEWDQAVTAVLAAIDGGEAAKVVLSREKILGPSAAVDVADLLSRLGDRFPECHTFAVDDLIGATPEMLLHIRGRNATSLVLAGSAPRGATQDQDLLLGRDLLHSAKDLHEHDLAVRSVADALLTAGAHVDHGSPTLLRLANIQHLATTIRADLAVDVPPLRLLGRLHPSAAVCGSPRESALRLIRLLEGARGRYGGPVGWIDQARNSEWGIALRCADLTGQDQARAFAGAGLVKGSEPEKEAAEIGWKLAAIADVFAESATTSTLFAERFEDELAVLGGLWLRWWELGSAMVKPLWSAPTRLDRWRVQDLYAHVARGVHVLGTLAANPIDAKPEIDSAAGYFECMQQTSSSAEVARAATQLAASTDTGTLVELFGREGIESLTAVARLPKEAVVASAAGPIRIGSYVQTRIVEATVHLLDLQHALGISDPAPAPALRRTTQVLNELTPDAEFIELATGRRTANDIFPVLT